MTDRRSLLQSISTIIADYRHDEISSPDAAHVEKWINQFDETVQNPILIELNHVLGKTYFTKSTVGTFLSNLITNAKLAGGNPCNFWKQVNFLSIQGGGNSQREMLGMFDEILQMKCGFGVEQSGSANGPFIYLDDAIYTGNRIKNDIIDWLKWNAPDSAQVHVIVLAYHRGGQWYAQSRIDKACSETSKTLNIRWWRCIEIEDRLSYINNSDVLRPSSIPTDWRTKAYLESLEYQPAIREGRSTGENSFFSSDKGRCLLEQEFLKAGLYIRSICPHLNRYQRPLGNMVLESLGFGALIATYRNCPNNAPLALWVGDPWYPLFPRKTN